MSDTLFDIIDARKFLERVVEHYERSAPTVAAWADDLYIRLGNDPGAVPLAEIMFLDGLWRDGRDGDPWTQPNLAANGVYHLMHRLGRDTTGHAGF